MKDSNGGEVVVVRRATATLQSTDALRNLILRGEIASGERLNEAELASEFGMSRGPIRESLQTLAAEGLVVIRSHKGTFVKSFTMEELHDLYRVRLMLESYACGQASSLHDSDEVAKLRALLDLSRQSLETGGAFLYENDFHLQVLAMTHSKVLANLGQQVLAQMALARLRSASLHARSVLALAEHVAICQAIEKRDMENAAALMKDHVTASYQNVIQTFEPTHGEANLRIGNLDERS